MTDVALRTFLVKWQFWMLEAEFVIVVIAAIVALRSVRFRMPSAVVGLVLFASGWILTATLPPRTNRIFYDEHIYQGVAHNMSDGRVTEMCSEGQVEYGRLSCAHGEYNKEPAGYPYLLSLLYRIGGVSEAWAPRLNNAAAGAAALVATGLTAMLFGSVFASIVAGVVLMLLPMQLTWSNTAAAEPVAALLCGAALLSAIHFARVRSNAAMALMISMTVFATTIRPESVLVVPLVAVAILVLAPDEWTRPRLWGGVCLGLVLILPTLAHLLAVRNERWGTTGSRLSWQHAADNLPVNFWFYFADERFPALVGIAAVVGLLARDRLRARLILLAYFLTFWTIFVFFYAGSYNYGADVRYSLMSYIPVAVLAGVGLERIVFGLTRRIRGPLPTRSAITATVTVLVLQFFWYAPLVRATGEEAWAARADVKYARLFAHALPPNSMVLTQNPSMFLLWGVDAAQLSIAVNDPAYVRDRLFTRYAGGVYMHWNFWCNVADPVQAKSCEMALELFPHDLIDSRGERDYRFSMYRLRKH